MVPSQEYRQSHENLPSEQEISALENKLGRDHKDRDPLFVGRSLNPRPPIIRKATAFPLEALTVSKR